MRTIAILIAAFALVVPAAAQTTSPFIPPQEKLGTYVLNSGGGLDTGCTFRSGGPLIVRFPVPATMNHNEVDAQGLLTNPNKLIGSSIIASTARIRFPVFDIDSGAATSGFAPEIDPLTFNGTFRKNLTGANNTWTDDSLTVPISEIRFQSTNSPNAMNELRVDIDQGNIGNGEFWCMAIDWVAIEFDAAAPISLLHGINSDASSWDQGSAPGVITSLDNAGVLWQRFSTGANARSVDNARDLTTQIKAFLDPLKAEKVHLIVHSKGGLDGQMMQALAPPFKILSLSTFSTPHLGSVSADLSIIAKNAADDKINSGQDPNGFASTFVNSWTFGQGPQLPGLMDLTTYEATAALAAGQRGNINPTFSIGADADLNGNNDLESGESAGLFPGIAHYAARRAWLVMRDFSAAPIVSTTTVPGMLWGTRTVLTYRTVPGGPFANDIVVTTGSANPAYATSLGNFPANHSTIKTGARIQQILPRILSLR
jgi:triacylglycerol lipase